MSRTGDASARAHARLRGFNGAVTVFGLIAVLIIGIVAFANSGGAGTAGADRFTTSDDFYQPWENPSPTAATADGERWSGRGQQYIPLTGLTPGEPLVLTLIDDSEFDDFYLTTGAAGEHEDAVSFDRYGVGGDYLIPSAAEMTLWPKVRTTDPWSTHISPVSLDEFSGTVSATKPKTFLYTGAATAARITVSGRATLAVITDQGVEDNYPWFDSESQSIAWPSTSGAVFIVESSPDASWTIEFYEPAPETTATSTPDPSSTPDPTASGAADE